MLRTKASQYIYQHFMAPFVSAYYVENHPLLSDPEYIIKELFFHVQNRIVVYALAEKPCKIEGILVESTQKLTPGFGPKEIKKGQELWISHDKREPNVYKTTIVHAGREWTYSQTELQFRRLKQNLKRRRKSRG